MVILDLPLEVVVQVVMVQMVLQEQSILVVEVVVPLLMVVMVQVEQVALE